MHNESPHFYLVYSENNFLYNDLKMTSVVSKWLFQFYHQFFSVKFQRGKPNKFKILNAKLPLKMSFGQISTVCFFVLYNLNTISHKYVKLIEQMKRAKSGAWQWSNVDKNLLSFCISLLFRHDVLPKFARLANCK